jgi:hypothetical protein
MVERVDLPADRDRDHLTRERHREHPEPEQAEVAEPQGRWKARHEAAQARSSNVPGLRVLILTASVGEGHDLPAQLLAGQIRADRPKRRSGPRPALLSSSFGKPE